MPRRKKSAGFTFALLNFFKKVWTLVRNFGEEP